MSWTIVLAKLEAHSGSSIRLAKVNLVLGNLKTIEVCQNNIQIVKAVSVKHSYHQKRSPEAGSRSKSTFSDFLAAKSGLFLAEVSEVVFNTQITSKYK